MKSNKSKNLKSNKQQSKKLSKKDKKAKSSEQVYSKSRKKKNAEIAQKNHFIPIRHHREPFKTLMISTKQKTVSADKTYALEMKRLGGKYIEFVKLDPPGEIMDSYAHRVGMPRRFSATLFGPSVEENGVRIHYVYNTYNFMDDLTKYDIYRRAEHYSIFIPKRKNASDDVKLAGMAVCAVFDMHRRKEKIRLRGRWRPEYCNYGRRMLESPRCLIAKQHKYAQHFFSHIIISKKAAVKEMINRLMHNMIEALHTNSNEAHEQFSNFMKHNRDWIRDRMKFQNTPLFLKFNRSRLYRNVVNRHRKMPYRYRGDQDLFNEFNYLSSHLAFSVHFCRVIRGFKLNATKEDEVIQKVSSRTPLIRVRKSRYSHFPAISVVNYDENDKLQTVLPRIPERAPSIAAVSGYSSDSSASTATNTPLDWELDWKFTDKEFEHRMNFLGDSARHTIKKAAERCFNERRWKEMARRKRALYKEDSRFELQDTVPIFTTLPKMHPPLFYCQLRGMELNKLKRTQFSTEDEKTVDMEATYYLFKQRINFLEKTLPCKDDPRILLSPGWKVFANRENPAKFRNVAKILRQRSSWVSKNCMSRSGTVPRCDKLPMTVEGQHKTVLLALLLVLFFALISTTLALISFL